METATGSSANRPAKADRARRGTGNIPDERARQPEGDRRQDQGQTAQEPGPVSEARRGEGGRGGVEVSIQYGGEGAQAEGLVNGGKWMVGHRHRVAGDAERGKGRNSHRVYEFSPSSGG